MTLSSNLFLLSFFYMNFLQQNLVKIMGEEPIVIPNLSECKVI